ncbi:prepilin-type N-terminal cleavage/methylation domain-containing protein [Ruminococcus sp.]
MNEIQAVKTAKIEEVKKNSKKGFTLVELVVVIAILAVLAAIAIPVVASTIKSSQISSAQSNAQTIETAIKEAKAATAAGDDSIFVANNHKASQNNLTVEDVLDAKKITSAATQNYTIDGITYSCVYDATDEKVYFAAVSGKDANGQQITKYSQTIGKDKNNISTHTVKDLTTTANDGTVTVKANNLVDLKVTNQANNQANNQADNG